MKAKTKEAVLRELILQSTQTICTPDDIIRALNKSGTHAKHTGQNYHLGMHVNVTLVNASGTTGLIDFIFTPDEDSVG